MIPPRRRSIGPNSAESLETTVYLARNKKFESIPLQRRVCKLSVPLAESAAVCADWLVTHPAALVPVLKARGT
jgi:hypothetical protein